MEKREKRKIKRKIWEKNRGKKIRGKILEERKKRYLKKEEKRKAEGESILEKKGKYGTREEGRKILRKMREILGTTKIEGKYCEKQENI